MEYIIVIILIFFSALFSGLTLGFFSLNKDDLKRKVDLGSKKAKLIYSVRENGNLLLTTLLVGNVAVNAALSIFLGSITTGLVAGLIATALIVIFGEIIPQAVFSRYAMDIGARFVPVVRLIRILFFPVCWPIAKGLDKLLGDEMPTVYSKHELIKLIEDHEELDESDIDADEKRIISGALSYAEKTVQDVMTPRTEIMALDKDQKITRYIIDKIKKRGHSRIPVFDETVDEIVGVLYAKDLVGDIWHNKTVGGMARKNVIFVDHSKLLDDLLNHFKRTRNHLFVVLDEFGGVAGIVTIEDVLEEILGVEIIDEYDRHEDLQAEAKKKMKNKKINKI